MFESLILLNRWIGRLLAGTVSWRSVSLRQTVAAAFRQRGTNSLAESEFVVAVSLDRGWFSPDQAQRLLDVAAGEGLVSYDEETVSPTFDTDEVDVPDGFEPADDVLRERSTFERVLAAVVEAGQEKQSAVAAINQLQGELGVSIEAAAIVYARQQEIEIDRVARQAAQALRDSS